MCDVRLGGEEEHVQTCTRAHVHTVGSMVGDVAFGLTDSPCRRPRSRPP